MLAKYHFDHIHEDCRIKCPKCSDQRKNKTGVAAFYGATPVFRRFRPILLLTQHLALLLNKGLHQAGVILLAFEDAVEEYPHVETGKSHRIHH